MESQQQRDVEHLEPAPELKLFTGEDEPQFFEYITFRLNDGGKGMPGTTITLRVE